MSTAHRLSRRGFCFRCLGASAFAATSGWMTPRKAYAEARGLVSLRSATAVSGRKSSARWRGLVNNAAIMALPELELTPQGRKMQFATKFLGHFALTWAHQGS